MAANREPIDIDLIAYGTLSWGVCFITAKIWAGLVQEAPLLTYMGYIIRGV